MRWSITIIAISVLLISGITSCTSSSQTTASPSKPIQTTSGVLPTATTVTSTNPLTSTNLPLSTDTNETTGKNVTIVSHTTYVDEYGYFHIIGEVVNEGDSTVTDCKIQVDYYDEEGVIAVSGNGETFRTLLGSGGKSPFEIILLKTPETATYKLTVSSRITDVLPSVGLSFTDTVLDPEDDLGYNLTGRCRNETNAALSAALIIGTFYSSDGTVTAVGYAFPDSLPLSSGAESEFALAVEYNGMPVVGFSLYAEVAP